MYQVSTMFSITKHLGNSYILLQKPLNSYDISSFIGGSGCGLSALTDTAVKDITKTDYEQNSQ